MDRKIIFFRRMAVIGLWFFTVVQAVSKHGDVILGGLFNVHQLSAENSKGQCGELDMKGLGRAMAMIFAVETINKNSPTSKYNAWLRHTRLLRKCHKSNGNDLRASKGKLVLT